jgi:hypothetical protein
LNALTHILSKIPYEELERAKVELPKRQHRGDYKDTDYLFRLIPRGVLTLFWNWFRFLLDTTSDETKLEKPSIQA